MGSFRDIRWGLILMAGVALAIGVSALAPVRGRAGAVPLSISVSGNHFVNGAGQTIRLLGVNTPSAEYTCAEGNGYDDGGFTDADASAIASWHVNAVRIPLNEDCWLGIAGYPVNDGDDTDYNSNDYRTDIENWVHALNNHGIYAILDLHWSAPGDQGANSQQPMPDADNSPDFWSSVATTFKSNPAVVFDLFNEPFDPTNSDSGDDKNQNDKVSWSCWKNGGCTTQSYEAQQEKTGARYETEGMQGLLDAVRATGATQPVLVGGLDYANDLSQWAQYAPTDPLQQVAADFHNYMFKNCSTQSCWDSTVAPLAANVPVVTGEFAEDDFQEPNCSVKTDSGFDAAYMTWADQHGVSYLAWAWYVLNQSEKDGQKCMAYYLSDDYNGTPAPPNGTVIHDHLAALAAQTGTAAPQTSTTSSTPTAPSSPTNGSTPTPGSAPLTPAPPPASGGGSHSGTTARAPALTRFGSVTKADGASLSISLRANQTCTAVLSGVTTGAFKIPGVKRAKRVPLGSVRVSLRSGVTRAVTFKLSGPARRLLVGRGTLRVQIAVTLTDSARRHSVSRHALTLRHGGR
jgi:hypothetical protein